MIRFEPDSIQKLNDSIRFEFDFDLNQFKLHWFVQNLKQKYHAIKSKNKNDLLNILQEVRFLFNTDNEVNDFVEQPEIIQQEWI